MKSVWVKLEFVKLWVMLPHQGIPLPFYCPSEVKQEMDEGKFGENVLRTSLLRSMLILNPS